MFATLDRHPLGRRNKRASVYKFVCYSHVEGKAEKKRQEDKKELRKKQKERDRKKEKKC